MPVIVIMKHNQIQLEVAGEEGEARRIMASRRPVAAKRLKNGRTIILRGKDVAFAEVITDAEYRRLLEEAQKKAAAAKKTNPNPGRDPRLVVPR